MTALGQEKTDTAKCDFLENLTFKNGTDTIIITGIKTANSKINLSENALKVAKKLGKDVHYLSSGIAIKRHGCNKVYLVSNIDFGEESLKLWDAAPTEPLYFRCIVFEGYYEIKQPFFIVDRISRKPIQ